MRDWLSERTQATPEAVALIFENQQWRYVELNRQVNITAAALRQSGVVPGDHVAALLPNSPAYVCLVHGLARIGAVLIPLNTRLTAPELSWQLDHTGSRWLVYDHTHADTAADLSGQDRALLDINRLWHAADSFTPLAESDAPAGFHMERLQAIVFTSGTTGHPKGAMLTFANHFWSATASSYRLGIDPGDRWLSCLPLYHVGGLAVIFRSCLYGSAVLLHQRFNLEAVSGALGEQGVTLASFVPTMLQRLLDDRGGKGWPASLRLILLGGAAASPELLQRCRTLDLPVAATYGLTEASSQVATMMPQQSALKPGSVGKPLMFTSVRVVDRDGQPVPTGTHGELVVSGPTVMSGYFNNPEATAEALRQGWLHTGDIGYLDADGDLWLLQRRSDIIISGGENVYPAEVEQVLDSHPAVAAACVVGVSSREWGQQVSALIALHEGAVVTEAELQAYCRTRLAGYKLPRLFRFTSQLPLTASGKIHRRAAAEQMAELAVR